MWLFTRYGFYSIASADKPDGSLDPDSLMIRSRVLAHLQNLKARFPALKDADVLVTPDRDYRYRVIVSKSDWAEAVVELVREQEWANFKSEAARHQGILGSDYLAALHETWAVMYRLQENTERDGPAPNRLRRARTLPSC